MIKPNKICFYLFLLFFPAITNGAVLNNSLSDNPAGVVIQVQEYREEIGRDTLNQWTKNQPRLEIDLRFRSEIENGNNCNLLEKPCALILTLALSAHTRKIDQASIDLQSIRNFVNDLERKINKDPIDAKFKVENDRVVEFASSQNGLRMNNSESVSLIEKNIQNLSDWPQNEVLIISLPYEMVEPAVKNNDDNGLGIATLIGEGVSNFSGSPKNRIFNINVATDRFNGVLIKPEEEFSFVSVLGEVDGEHGYLPELVIKRDKTEPEFGGGICQVSTTAFRAAIYSGLKITARRNHAYPVRYYNPQGMDATVYVPRPDLRFINNTPGYILIQTKIEGTVLKFQFYGTSDGRKIEIEGPTITARNSDGSMKATFTQNVFDKDGNKIISDIFNSNYDSPNKYPHPGQETKLTTKPKNWSDREWKVYKKANGM